MVRICLRLALSLMLFLSLAGSLVVQAHAIRGQRDLPTSQNGTCGTSTAMCFGTADYVSFPEQVMLTSATDSRVSAYLSVEAFGSYSAEVISNTSYTYGTDGCTALTCSISNGTTLIQIQLVDANGNVLSQNSGIYLVGAAVNALGYPPTDDPGFVVVGPSGTTDPTGIATQTGLATNNNNPTCLLNYNNFSATCGVFAGGVITSVDRGSITFWPIGSNGLNKTVGITSTTLLLSGIPEQVGPPGDASFSLSQVQNSLDIFNANSYALLVYDSFANGGAGALVTLGGLQLSQPSTTRDLTAPLDLSHAALPFRETVDASRALSPTPFATIDAGAANAPTPPSCASAGSFAGSLNRVVQYSYTPTQNQVVTIDTAGSRLDTVILVSAGGTQIACDDDFVDDAGVYFAQAKIPSLALTAGVNYVIQVGEYPSQMLYPTDGVGDGPPYDPATNPCSDGTSNPLSCPAINPNPILQFSLATATTAPPNASCGSCQIAFGSISVGETFSENLVITNTGGSNLVISSVTSSDPAFAVTNGCTAQIVPNGTCTIGVAFSPTKAIESFATLTITDNSGASSTQEVGLNGYGSQPEISTSTTQLSFAAQRVGTTSGATSLTIANTGNAPLVVSLATTAGFTATGCADPVDGESTCQIEVVFAPTLVGSSSGTLLISSVTPAPSQTVQLSGTGTPGPGLQFVPITPCRVADTRNSNGLFGGPQLGAGESREFDIPQSSCAIPSTAMAYSLNVTAAPVASLGYLTLWSTGQLQPNVSTLNSADGRLKANAAITPAGTNGGVSVYVSDPSDVILDIDGYFVPVGTASALEFFPVTPCRVVDTRNVAGPLGGPFISGQGARSFPLSSGPCSLPAAAQAYSMNVTAVPHQSLGYLTTWPTGQAQPVVSTLNAPTGTLTANAAIVQAGTNGEVSIYVSNDADVIVDVNGYFATPASGGLSLQTAVPCRALDTRTSIGPIDGLSTVDVVNSGCGLPPEAQAYVLNATVLPEGPLGFLTLWPDETSQPSTSTLNATDGSTTSNMAIVPTSNGIIDVFTSSSSQLILDSTSYFAP